MLQQTSTAITFLAFFVASKFGKTSLTPTVDVYRDGTKIVTDGSATEIGGGLYSYTLASGSTGTAGSYVAVFKTSDATVDAQHIPSLWIIGSTWVANVDATITSRLASASYTTPPTVGAIDAQLSGVHGTGAWGAAGASGEYTVTLTLRDAATLATLRDVLVTVKNSGDTTTLDQKRASAAGVVTFSLDAATYTLHASLPGYQTLSQSLAIAGNTTANVDLTAIAVGEPSAPNLCRVYGYLYLNSAPLSAATVTARLTALPQTTSAVVLDGAAASDTTDADGYFALDLVREKRYALEIASAGVSKIVVVPDSASVDVRELL